MARVRTKPYTQIGIRRVKCSMKGCRRKGYASWQVCADDRAFRVLCWIHDIALNSLVLRWVGDPQAVRKISKYSAKVIAKVNGTP